MTKILVCNPEYFQISYEINPWMKVENQSDKDLAKIQWNGLVEKLKQAGAEVVEMKGEPNLPDLVFTANAGLVLPNKKVILAKFKCPERQPERYFYNKWFSENGYEIIEDPYPQHTSWEGAGDTLYQDDVLFLGSGFRSDYLAVYNRNWWNIWGKTCFYMNLQDPYFYHLDTCFCPLPNKYALIYPSAFNKPMLESLSKTIKLLKVCEEEAKKFACNAVCIEKTVIIPSDCPQTKSLLNEAGFEVLETDMSEFLKSGGGPKCATLKV